MYRWEVFFFSVPALTLLTSEQYSLCYISMAVFCTVYSVQCAHTKQRHVHRFSTLSKFMFTPLIGTVLIKKSSAHNSSHRIFVFIKHNKSNY